MKIGYHLVEYTQYSIHNVVCIGSFTAGSFGFCSVSRIAITDMSCSQWRHWGGARGAMAPPRNSET